VLGTAGVGALNELWLAAQRRGHRAFRVALSRPAETQAALLRALLARHADSAYGRRWGFARLRTPRGETEIALEVEHDVRSGIVDWRMTFADGSVAFANSRLTRGSDGRLVYAFVLHAPPLPLEEIEGALREQSHTLARELVRLKALVEHRDGSR